MRTYDPSAVRGLTSGLARYLTLNSTPFLLTERYFPIVGKPGAVHKRPRVREADFWLAITSGFLVKRRIGKRCAEAGAYSDSGRISCTRFLRRRQFSG